MAKFLVTYDPIKRKDYPELIGVLQKFNYWHCLGSVWIIPWDGTAEELAKFLYPHIDADDKLLVVECGPDRAWTRSFPEDCKEWLRKNF
ncbi:hypothetical protein [Acidovorax sp. NB1]|uniref:hypothetical protein n=1 Tax=Acidovorax sp. NB1 TaxID=1943571 RepID=UPI0010D97EBA|nr:hypothetical protein [Acidovorax sp. NB1]GDY37728.1 hypothetical protein ACINB_36200 [Acidovorax sp. NB1]